MGSVSTALSVCNAKANSAATYAMSLKGRNDPQLYDMLSPPPGQQFLTQYQQSGVNKQRYFMFKGWVHAAINALAMKAATQPVQVGILEGAKVKGKSGTKQFQQNKWDSHTPKHILNTMPKSMSSKAAQTELRIIPDHIALASLETPNPMQNRFQFVYSFVANLCLTGWGYVFCGENEDGVMEYYSVPTTWVIPDHQQGAYTRFRIVNPNNPTQNDVSKIFFDRTQVWFAQIPDPSDPLRALSPTQAQADAIKIDGSIQTSQTAFFQNCPFPGMLITIGTNPLGELGGQPTRPRLTAAQRRGVIGAIQKQHSGVANYGNPAIVDGLIEKIERLQMTQQEMGWEKSEITTRTRILAAFSVHPFILGENMPGSYAQAAIVQQVFCDRVNIYLEMLGWVMTGLVRAQENSDENLLIWYSLAKASDPQMEMNVWNQARQRGDVTQNEFRAFMDLPPDEDSNEQFINQFCLPQCQQIALQVTAGQMSVDQAVAILEGLGLPTPLAVKIAGDGPPPEMMMPDPALDGPDVQQNTDASDNPDNSDVQKAIIVLEKTMAWIDSSPEDIADAVLEEA